MSPRVTLSLMVLLSSAASASPGCARFEPHEETRAPMDRSVPLEIRLTAGRGPDLEAVLVNRSRKVQAILHDTELQPSRLLLFDAQGAAIDPFDSRSIKKYDATVYDYSFQNLAPGQELKLFAARFQRSGKGASVSWGPFEFEELPAGVYAAKIVWESRIEAYLDEGTQEVRRLPSVWLGSLESNTVTVRLP